MFSSMRLRAFLMAFTSAFLCFIVFWMAVLLTNPTAVSSSRQQEEVPLEQGGSLYLPTKSDCMTLLLCEEGEHPSLFFLLRFDPVEGRIPIFAFPQQLVLTHKQVAEPAEKIFAVHGIEGIRQALQESWKLSVDRYLMLSREATQELLQQFGPTALTLSEQVELTVGGIGITLEKGVQLLDGQRLWELLRKEVPADTLLQCELLPELMALCINQHLEYLQQDYSSSLFSAAVNAGTSDLIFSDYDARKQAASFLSQLSEQPAQPLTAEFVRNLDATLSLSADSLQAVLAAFGAQAAPTQSS